MPLVAGSDVAPMVLPGEPGGAARTPRAAPGESPGTGGPGPTVGGEAGLDARGW
jgi:hypothetical protein